MEALRKLRLSRGESLLEMPHIQLPNLDSLFCNYTRDHCPAPCIPATVSELTIKGTSTCILVPSPVTIVYSFQSQRALPLLASAQQIGSAP